MNSTLILIQTLIAYVGVLIMLTWHIKQYASHTKSTLWGPNDLWARPIYPGRIQKPKPRRAMAQTRQDSLWIPSRVVQSSADPKYPQREG